MTLENGIPNHDTFSWVFKLLVPSGLQKTLLRLAQNWADRLGRMVAVDGKVLRQSFEKASTVTGRAALKRRIAEAVSLPPEQGGAGPLAQARVCRRVRAGLTGSD